LHYDVFKIQVRIWSANYAAEQFHITVRRVSVVYTGCAATGMRQPVNSGRIAGTRLLTCVRAAVCYMMYVHGYQSMFPAGVSGASAISPEFNAEPLTMHSRSKARQGDSTSSAQQVCIVNSFIDGIKVMLYDQTGV
jgi:hypothetical protein